MEQTTGPEKKEKNTGMAIIAYILFFVPLLTDARKDPFVKYHVKQGLVLFIAGLIVGWIPFFNIILGIFIFVIWIMGIMNAASGQEKPLPVIGQFAEKFNI